MLSESDIDETLIKDSKIFHFGSLSMTDEVCRKATRKAIEIAEKSGAILSYDPNLREPLWKSMDEAKEQILYGMQHCNVLKISDNEIQWLTGMEDYDAGILLLMEKYHIPLILLSMGKNGSRAYTDKVPSGNDRHFVTEDTIETTGAGEMHFAVVSCITYWNMDGVNTMKRNLERCWSLPMQQHCNNKKGGASGNAQVRGDFACAKRSISQKK